MKRIASILFLLVICCVACQNDMAEVERFISAEEMQVEVMEEVEVLYSDSAVVRVKIDGPRLLRHVEAREPYEEFTEGVQVTFFDEQGKSASLLTAQYGVRYPARKEVRVRGEVVWERASGETLETEELIWSQEEQKIYSNDFTTITRPREVIYGYGFETSQDFKRWTIKSVEGQISVDQ